ncbi:uncharacterized protein At1g27050 [Nicotiana tabacum]|uniref:Uncharacterized protein At1g27050 n=1 Tax=Nicotiana tabacum TaxID=4097 RepID=A0AC58TG45_TOBAC
MGRKRDRTHFNRHVPYSFPKRRRPPPTDAVSDDPLPSNNSSSTTKQQPGNVVVVGVPTDCSVLDLKSRFEIYGSISRTRMDPNGLAYITFRSYDSAQSAVNAAVDSSFPITLHSKPIAIDLLQNFVYYELHYHQSEEFPEEVLPLDKAVFTAMYT